MKKMPTLFIRDFNSKVKATRVVNDDCHWVITVDRFNLTGANRFVPTVKRDGTCTMYKEGVLWKRYDAKRGKPIPEGAVLCQPEADAVTGHLPCWVKVTDEPCDKWFKKAFERERANGYVFVNGATYELCGPHFQNNPYDLASDRFFKHGDEVLEDFPKLVNFDTIHSYLSVHNIEGIVFHKITGEMCKIKRSDFGLDWNNKKS